MRTGNQAEWNSGVALAEISAQEEILPCGKGRDFATTRYSAGIQRAALGLPGRILWHVPGCFGLTRLFGPRCLLRCVLFHDVSDTESLFTRGIGVTITRSGFEAALRFLTKHYTPVSLQDVLTDSNGRGLPPRPVLVTFDDAYVSVREVAAPLCQKFGVPAVFFVNAASVDNLRLGLDNLVCYVANVSGLDTINTAARIAGDKNDIKLHSLSQVFTRFLPAVSLATREVFRDALIQLAGIRERVLASEAGIYLTSKQLRDLATFNFEIGNHTYTHVNCRDLSAQQFGQEIDKNKVILEEMSGSKVRSFSVPYGSSTDLTTDLVVHLKQSGYEAAFLVESIANPPNPDRFRLNRVSVKTGSDAGFFSEIEVLPRLRTIRNRLLGA